MNNEPYIIQEIRETYKVYNPEYGDDRVCKCGHSYYRHFDSYEGMANVGCKYCGCYEFVEKEEAPVWIVEMCHPYEGDKFLGVFSTKEAATEAVDKCLEAGRYRNFKKKSDIFWDNGYDTIEITSVKANEIVG